MRKAILRTLVALSLLTTLGGCHHHGLHIDIDDHHDHHEHGHDKHKHHDHD